MSLSLLINLALSEAANVYTTDYLFMRTSEFQILMCITLCTISRTIRPLFSTIYQALDGAPGPDRRFSFEDLEGNVEMP